MNQTEFDPYREWLQIGPGPRPPDHYTLLGLARGEAAAHKIQEAYAHRMTVVRRYQVGGHESESKRLVTEISKAYTCLTDAAAKSEYDAQLASAETLIQEPRQTLNLEPAAKPTRELPKASRLPEKWHAAADNPAQIIMPAAEVAKQPATPAEADASSARRTSRKRQRQNQWLMGAGAAGVGLVLIIGLIWGASQPAVPNNLANARPARRPEVELQLPTDLPTDGTAGSAKTPVAPDYLPLAALLDVPQRPGNPLKFLARLHAINQESVEVAAEAPDKRTVVVAFNGDLQTALARSSYKPGDAVQVEGSLVGMQATTPEAYWTVTGIAVQKPGDPASRVQAADLSPKTPPATPLASDTNSTTPSNTTPTTTPSVPKPKPNVPTTAKTTSPSTQSFAASGQLWRDMQSNAARYYGQPQQLSGLYSDTTTSGRERTITVRAGNEYIRLTGEFLPEGLALLDQLRRDDPVDCEVYVSPGRSRSSPGFTLMSISRKTAPALQARFSRFPPPPEPMLLTGGLGANAGNSFQSLAWHPKGTELVAASDSIHRWDAREGKYLGVYLNSAGVRRLEWSADAKLLFAMATNDLKGFDTANGANRFTTRTAYSYEGHMTAYAAPTNRILYAEDYSGRERLLLIDPIRGGSLLLDSANLSNPSALALSPDGAYAAWAGTSLNASGICVISTKNPKTRFQFPITTRIVRMWISPGKTPFLAVQQNDSLSLLDITKLAKGPEAAKLLTIANSNLSNGEALVWTEDRRKFAMNLYTGLEVWSVDAPNAALWKRTGSRQNVAWSPDGRFLAILDSSSQATICSATGDALLTFYFGENFYGDRMVWSPQGDRLAVAARGSVQIWDLSALASAAE